MRTTVITFVAAVAIGATGTAHATARPRAQRFKAAVARHTPRPMKDAVAKRLVQLQRARKAVSARRDLHRGKALADVQRYGRTRIRSAGDLMWSPGLHGAVAFAGLLAVGTRTGMAALAAGLIYFASRSGRMISNGWLALENQTIAVLERQGPEAARSRLAQQGHRDPAAAVKRLQNNRHLRNGSYPTGARQ